MLEMGRSKPWQEAMQVLTGSTQMDARPILEYFQPLLSWLKDQNKNSVCGWHPASSPNNSFTELLLSIVIAVSTVVLCGVMAVIIGIKKYKKQEEYQALAQID